MTVEEVIQLLESGGWRQRKCDESCRQFQHDSKTGTVTLSGRLDMRVPPGVLRTLIRYAQIDEEV